VLSLSRLDPAGVAFFALALLTLGSAVVVARSRNVLHAALALLGTLAGVAGLAVTLAADYVALAEVLVYVGGTLVLFLLAAMLTTRRDQAATSNEPGPTRRATLASVVLVAGFTAVAIDTVWPTPDRATVTSTAKLGHALLGPYLLPFELTAFVLVLSVIAAATVARRAVRPDAPEAPEAPRA
jgi:NAD(P)H-quinone oxidoreductase subunit 6